MTWLDTVLGSLSLRSGQITYAEEAWRDLHDEAWWKEDLLQVEYQGDFLLDIGWYGDGQDTGEFQVRVIHNGNWAAPAFECSVMDRNALLPVIEQAVQWIGLRQAPEADQEIVSS